MKKIILVILLSIFFTISLYVTYSFVDFVKTFKYEKKSFDNNLTYNKSSLKYQFLQKLDYKIEIKIFNFNKKNNKIIFVEKPISKSNLKKLKEWVSSGKRLIIFYQEEVDLSTDYETLEDSNATDNDIYDDLTSDYYDKKDYYNDYYVSDNDFIVLDVNSTNKLFKNVKKIITHYNKSININNKSIFGENITPLLYNEDKIIIAKEKINGGEIIYIADQYIFSDRNILKKDNAQLLNNLAADYFKEKIIFDDSREKKEDEEEPPFFLFMGNFKFLFIQLILILIIVFFTFFKRFGLIIDKEKFERKSTLYHLEAVGCFFEKSKNLQVITKRLDEYFYHKLKQIIRIGNIGEQHIFAEIKNRFNITKEEERLFKIDNYSDIVEIELKRLKFLKKLSRGVLK